MASPPPPATPTPSQDIITNTPPPLLGYTGRLFKPIYRLITVVYNTVQVHYPVTASTTISTHLSPTTNTPLHTPHCSRHPLTSPLLKAGVPEHLMVEDAAMADSTCRPCPLSSRWEGIAAPSVLAPQVSLVHTIHFSITLLIITIQL